MSTGNVVVIGVFDGVHKGHQLLLDRAKGIADSRSIIALTFDPHPIQVLAPGRAPTMLTTLADRVELLKIHNADQVAVLKFNEKFAAMSPEDFVKDGGSVKRFNGYRWEELHLWPQSSRKR
jgi:riboflavin kinase/FMN adenylyltransferase